MAYKSHNEAHGRGVLPTGASRRKTKQNGPPPGEPWVWCTQEMVESEAWRAMNFPTRQVVDRIALEHMLHAGTENGNLIVPYNDFEAYGIRYKSIPDAIEMAKVLGFIDVIERGSTSFADLRRPSRYALAWLPLRDGTPASKRWRKLQSPADVKAALQTMKENRARERGDRSSELKRRQRRKKQKQAAVTVVEVAA
jgi:hypothetical protein